MWRKLLEDHQQIEESQPFLRVVEIGFI